MNENRPVVDWSYEDEAPYQRGRNKRDVSELFRLRLLLKSVEWGRMSHGARYCPWCNQRVGSQHRDDCDAFTPGGQVK